MKTTLDGALLLKRDIELMKKNLSRILESTKLQIVAIVFIFRFGFFSLLFSRWRDGAHAHILGHDDFLTLLHQMLLLELLLWMMILMVMMVVHLSGKRGRFMVELI